MNGTIWFETVRDLAEFLKEFEGCNALFSVIPADDGYSLSFGE